MDPHIKTETAIQIARNFKQARGFHDKWSAVSALGRTFRAKKKAHKKTRKEKGSPANILMLSGARDWQYA